MKNWKLAGQFLIATVIAGGIATAVGHWFPPTSPYLKVSTAMAIAVGFFGILLLATVCISVTAIIAYIGRDRKNQVNQEEKIK